MREMEEFGLEVDLIRPILKMSSGCCFDLSLLALGVGLRLVRPGPCSVHLSWGLEESSPCLFSLPLTFPRMGQGLLHSIPPILQMEKPRPQE